MSNNNSWEQIATVVGLSVIAILVISILSYFLYNFYYAFIIGGGLFFSLVIWKNESKNGVNILEKLKNTLFAFVFGAAGVFFVIVRIYDSNAPWMK